MSLRSSSLQVNNVDAFTAELVANIATLNGEQELSNKSLVDGSTFVVNTTNKSKKVKFDASGISDGTTRTLAFPNVNGTLVTTGDSGTVTRGMIASGTITSELIANETIVNSDISSVANISDTKLDTISTAGKVANSATTATSANVNGAIVARNNSGAFSGTLNGNASTATKLANAVSINGTSFDGSEDITVESKVSSVASASTINISGANIINVTGSTNISSLGSALVVGTRRTLIFENYLILEHGTNLVSISNVDIHVGPGSVVEVLAETLTKWVVVSVTNNIVGRADKMLATMDIANVIGNVDGDITKVRYGSDTDVNYEKYLYSDGNLVSIEHYVKSVLAGTTSITYSSGGIAIPTYSEI